MSADPLRLAPAANGRLDPDLFGFECDAPPPHPPLLLGEFDAAEAERWGAFRDPAAEADMEGLGLPLEDW